MPLVDIDRAREYLSILRERVSERTLNHCIGTAEYMASFASALGIEPQTAVTTGLLHDLCKGLPDDIYLVRAVEYGIQPNEVQRMRPKLLHGPVAAEMCRRELGVDDPAIHDAIWWHTTGRPDWTHLGLAVYVADFAERTRTFAEAADARTIMEQDGFWRALRYVADQKARHLQGKSHVDPITMDFHFWLETLTS